MIKVILKISSLAVIVLFHFSCDYGCNDCNPITARELSMKNTLNSQLDFRFFSYSRESQVEEFSIVPDERLVLYLSIFPTSEGALSRPPYYFDSTHIMQNGEILHRFVYGEGCEIDINPLCENNYDTIRHEELRNGDVIIEQQIILK